MNDKFLKLTMSGMPASSTPINTLAGVSTESAGYNFTPEQTVSIFDFEAVGSDSLSGKKLDDIQSDKATTLNELLLYSDLDSIFSSQKGQEAFASIDTNGNGTLDADEVAKLALAGDNNANDVSISDIKEAFKDILSLDVATVTNFNQDSANALQDSLNDLADQTALSNDLISLLQANEAAQFPSSGASGTSGGSKSEKEDKVTIEDEIKQLETKKEEVITKADSDIKSQNDLLNQTVQGSTKITQEMKDNYNTLNSDMGTINNSISDNDKSIDENSASIASVDNSIAALEGEKGSISTSTDNEEINKQNTDRLTAIDGEIKTKQDEKTQLETKKTELEATKSKLETDKSNKQLEIDKALEAIEAADPAIKEKIESIKTQIKTLETDKTDDVKEIDDQIQAKRAEQVTEQKEIGKQIGQAANGIGSDVIQEALQYLGYNEADGSFKRFTDGRDEAWCADFVTTVIQETYAKKGMELPEGFGSPSVRTIQQWGKDNNCYADTASMSNSDKTSYIANNVKAGDVIIFQENGRSHTGLVESVDSDGTIHTVEGNTSDKVARRTYDATESSLSGFVQLNKYKK